MTFIVSLGPACLYAGIHMHLFMGWPAGQDQTISQGPTSRPARTVDDEVVRRLLGGESSAQDTVEETLSRMQEACDLLADRFETGDKTRGVQAQVVSSIDKLIEQAQKNSASGRAGSTTRRPREKAGGRPSRRASTKGSDKSAPNPQGGGAPAEGEGAGERRGLKSKSQMSRGWGYLPQREREEISQGFDEEFLPKYREHILKYYRRLAEEANRE